jgi:hypothetical protein
VALGSGPEEDEEGGQQGQIEDEGDDHARPGDEAQVPHPEVGGGREGKEADCGRNRRHRERRAHPGGGLAHGFDRLRRQALRRVAHAELDAEIDRDPDEERGEGD